MPATLPPDLTIGTLAVARGLVEEVGRRVVALGDELRGARAKEGVDVVTAADGLIERELTAALAERFPDHRIAAEEGTTLGPAGADWTWHLDPLDGTGNYSRGLPYWAISLGLAHRDRPVLGVVHGPVCGITVSGGEGVGAWSGERPLPRATPPGEPRTWMVATDWPWDLVERQRTSTLLARLAPTIRQYKTFGSAAIDLAHLALGHVDAYAISKAYVWDVAAGAAIVHALGYELKRWNGEPWDLSCRDIVACRPGMWPTLSPACA